MCFCSSDEFDAYIIVSFVNATLVLSIGETVEEVTDSGFLGTTPTLSCSLLGEDALVQVGEDSFTSTGHLKMANECKCIVVIYGSLLVYELVSENEWCFSRVVQLFT